MHQRGSIPQELLDSLSIKGIAPDTVAIAIRTDLSRAGRFSREWVGIAADLLFVLTSHDKDGELQTLKISDIQELKAESLVSSGMLTVKIAESQRILCRFSNACAREIGEFVKAFKKVKEGKDLGEEDFKAFQARSVCPTCGLRYPDPERPICPKCLDKRSLFLRVMSYVPRYGKPVTLMLACMVASSLIALLIPYLGGRVFYDEVLTKGGRYYGKIAEVVLFMVGIQIMARLVSVAYGRINARVAAWVVFDLKTEIFAAMQRLSLSFFSKKQTGTLMTRVNHDSMHLQYFFHDGIPYFVVNSISILGIGAAMAVMNWKLALLVFLPAPLIVFIVKELFPRLWSLFSRQYRRQSFMTSLVNDALSGARVVKSFGKETDEINRFIPANQEVYAAHLTTIRLSSTIFPMVQFVMQIGGLIVWATGGWQVVNGGLSFGTLMTFIGYLTMIYGPLQFMTMIADWWSSCMNSAQRIFEILDAVPEVAESSSPTRLLSMRGDVAMRDVTFAYEPNNPVIHEVTLEIKAGEMVGLVGHTGAGKSTLINLISRLYDAQEGEVRIDGVNVKSIPTKDLRSQIGIVLQETYLFSGTIAENIAYARPDASREEVMRAAQAANAHDFIVALPNGYDTLLGRKGQELSAGEKQRIAIARAILLDPRILIFDEATSSLDTKTEKKIQEAIERMIHGRTTIAIAHRLSTLRSAHRLVVLEKGKIVEQGTHAELVQLKGVYYKLVHKEREALRAIGVGT